ANSYKMEVDRQEGLFTSLITALAAAVSIILMIVPGVNLVVAGIWTAVLAGAATIIVKAGMRGGRYRWGEAATDVAMTAIGAGTAGLGGGLGGGLGKAGMFGRMAAFGKALEGPLGRIGGAMAREAIVGAVNGAAQVALQDETWRDGPGKGLSRVA